MSPIIATILLVAITVVLAAVLYILVSGLIGGGSKPYSVTFAGETSVSYGAPTIYVANFTITATSGLTTGDFGIKISSPGGASVPSGTVPGACTASASFGACVAPASGWYAVLVTTSGTVYATFPSATGGWTPGNVAFNAPLSLSLVSAAKLAGSADTLQAYAASGSSVSGQATL